MTRQALGRGLGALIPQLESGSELEVRQVPLGELVPGGYQPRRAFNEEKLAELASSIKAHGVVQPLLVRPRRGKDGYEIVAGERRWRAAGVAGLTEVPAIVRDLNDSETMKIALVENLQREDLDPVEEAEAYNRLIGEFAMTQEDVAASVGKSRPLVANMLRLLQLPAQVRQAISAGKISAGHGRALLGVPEEREQLALFRRVAERGLTVRETEKLVEKAKAKQPEKAKPTRKEIELRALEDDLRRALGTKVKIRPGRKNGHIDIEFYGREDLDRLTNLLGIGR